MLQDIIPSHVALYGTTYLLVINLLTFIAFWRDKTAARNGTIRTPETTLLTLAVLGGSIGAKLAQRRFRHKTRKEPFRTVLNFVLGFHIILIIAISIKSAMLIWS